jgi:hypothetical protein
MDEFVKRALEAARLERERHDRLLDRLVSEFDIEDRSELAEWIDEAEMAFIGARYWRGTEFDDRAADSLEELNGPLGNAIELLWKDINFHRLVRALASARKSNAETECERLCDLIRDIDEIRRVARAARKQGQNRGRPKDHDLHELVTSLAKYWEGTLGRKFTQYWHTETTGKDKGSRKPISHATRFVHMVVESIDRALLPRLASVTKQVAASLSKNGHFSLNNGK